MTSIEFGPYLLPNSRLRPDVINTEYPIQEFFMFPIRAIGSTTMVRLL